MSNEFSVLIENCRSGGGVVCVCARARALVYVHVCVCVREYLRACVFVCGERGRKRGKGDKRSLVHDVVGIRNEEAAEETP